MAAGQHSCSIEFWFTEKTNTMVPIKVESNAAPVPGFAYFPPIQLQQVLITWCTMCGRKVREVKIQHG